MLGIKLPVSDLRVIRGYNILFYYQEWENYPHHKKMYE